jgi:hypothetical protein
MVDARAPWLPFRNGKENLIFKVRYLTVAASKARYAGSEGKQSCSPGGRVRRSFAGCFGGNDMFSKKPRALEHHGEIVYPGEAFTWQVDETVTQGRCRRARKRQLWATCLGLTLALIVLGNALDISWLVSAVAVGQTTTAQLK